MNKRFFIPVYCAFLSFMACTPSAQEKVATVAEAPGKNGYQESIEKWHKEREESLKKEDGWLALAGLFWLNEGENTFGSSDENRIVFPDGKIAGKAGAFILQDNEVRLKVAPDAAIKLNGETVAKQATVYTSEMQEPPIMTHGSLSWFVLQRGDKYGIRLRDMDSEIRKNFKGVDRFPVSEDWKIEAQLVPNAFPKQIGITNILGQTSQENSPGTLVFTVNGKQHSLDVLEEGNELFIIFADKTNGAESYGAGRYLYADKPGADGKTILDFNKATNPPCAFVPYATCPLPPKQNFISIAIPAGEKAYEAGH